LHLDRQGTRSLSGKISLLAPKKSHSTGTNLRKNKDEHYELYEARTIRRKWQEVSAASIECVTVPCLNANYQSHFLIKHPIFHVRTKNNRQSISFVHHQHKDKRKGRLRGSRRQKF
jgi:hypothetical protein